MIRTYHIPNLLFFSGVIGHVQLIGGLAVEPKLRRVAKKRGKANCRIGCNSTATGNNRLYTALRHSRGQGKLSLAQSDGLKEFLQQNLPPDVREAYDQTWYLLVVINNFNVISVFIMPNISSVCPYRV